MSNAKIVGVNVELRHENAWRPFMRVNTTRVGVLAIMQHVMRKEQQSIDAGDESIETRITFNAAAFENEPAVIDMNELQSELDASW